ncbi:MAG: hypothetical protein JSS98_05585 [Bacteroidetes bacterium]|nr:hypothetical protein [Bacteroidota bacterium]
MKRISLMLTSLLVAVSIYSQYTVTKVNGQVVNLTTNELLKPGSHLSETDKMKWSSPRDRVRTIIAGKGIYIITPSPESQKERSKLVDVVKFTLHIKSREFNLSGRSDNEEIIPWVLSTESVINNKNLITPINRYLVDTTHYSVSNGGRFFLQANHRNDEAIIKPLQVVADTLYLYADSFLVNGITDSADVKYTVGYYNKVQNSSVPLIRLYPYFDTGNEMKTLLEIIINSDGHDEKEQLRVSCYQEVYETMGKPSSILFNELFNQLYKKLRTKAER